ncbi:hypothetical protein ABTK21_19430, partial [Acinetobacter baumannii]
MSATQITLVANLFTMIVVVIAAIKRPIPSYITLATLSVIVSIVCGYEVITGKATIFATLATFALVILIMIRISL